VFVLLSSHSLTSNHLLPETFFGRVYAEVVEDQEYFAVHFWHVTEFFVGKTKGFKFMHMDGVAGFRVHVHKHAGHAQFKIINKKSVMFQRRNYRIALSVSYVIDE